MIQGHHFDSVIILHSKIQLQGFFLCPEISSLKVLFKNTYFSCLFTVFLSPPLVLGATSVSYLEFVATSLLWVKEIDNRILSQIRMNRS